MEKFEKKTAQRAESPSRLKEKIKSSTEGSAVEKITSLKTVEQKPGATQAWIIYFGLSLVLAAACAANFRSHPGP